MRTLTDADRKAAWLRIAIIQAIQKQVDERLAFQDTQAYEELDQIERVAYAVISEGIAKTNQSMIADLRQDLGFNDEEALAQVIELTDYRDGQHRSGPRKPQ